MSRQSEERKKYQRQWARARHGHLPQKRPNAVELAEINRLLKLREVHRIIAEQTGWSKALIDKISRRNKGTDVVERALRREQRAARFAVRKHKKIAKLTAEHAVAAAAQEQLSLARAEARTVRRKQKDSVRQMLRQPTGKIRHERRRVAKLLAADWHYELIAAATGLTLDEIGYVHSMLDALLEED